MVNDGDEDNPQPEVTVKVAVQVEELPDASVAVKVIVCVPTALVVPAAGLCVTVTDEQLSVALTPEVKSGTVAVPVPPADID